MKILILLSIAISFTAYAGNTLRIIVPKGVTVSTERGFLANAVFNEKGERVKVQNADLTPTPESKLVTEYWPQGSTGWIDVPQEVISEALKDGNCFRMEGNYHYRIHAFTRGCATSVSKCKMGDPECGPAYFYRSFYLNNPHYIKAAMPPTDPNFRPMDQSTLFKHIHGLK